MKIEFKWKRVGIWDGRPHVKVGNDGPCVLQFRYVTELRDDETDRPYQGWSSWVDVEVQEARDNG